MTAAALAQALLAKNVGNDQFTKSLIHFDTATIADAAAGAASAHTWSYGTGSSTSATQSKFGGFSGSFTGGSTTSGLKSSVHLSDLDVTSSDFTIDCWAYLTGGSGGRVICTDGNAGATNASYSHYLLVTAGGLLQINVYQGTTAIAINSLASFPTNTWTHVAVVRSGTTLTLYVNGVSQGTASVTGAINTSTSINSIGIDANVTSWPGFIDEFRFSVGIARWTTAFTPPGVPYP